MCILHLISQLKPRPSFHNALNEIRVIAWTYKILYFMLVFLHRLHYKIIRKANSPYEVTVIV